MDTLDEHVLSGRSPENITPHLRRALVREFVEYLMKLPGLLPHDVVMYLNSNRLSLELHRWSDGKHDTPMYAPEMDKKIRALEGGMEENRPKPEMSSTLEPAQRTETMGDGTVIPVRNL